MAQRRMFSKSITNSSRFLMMPQSAQNLYFHLGMNADDDGFCEHFTIMRMTESKPDDLKILQAKEFIHIFDDKILIIVEWKENNYIQKDRYSPSKYLEIYKKEVLQLSEGKSSVYKMDTQVRLGKVRLDNTTTKVVVSKAPSYGNEDINTVISFLKERLGGSPDGSQRDNRHFAQLLLNKLKKDYPTIPPVDVVKRLIESALKDPFHAKNATGFKYLFYNTQKIIQTVKEQVTNPKYIRL